MHEGGLLGRDEHTIAVVGVGGADIRHRTFPGHRIRQASGISRRAFPRVSGWRCCAVAPRSIGIGRYTPA